MIELVPIVILKSVAPLWAWSLTANYTIPITGAWNFDAGGGYRHGGSSWSGVQGASQAGLQTAFLDPAYNQLDLHIGVSDDSWRISLYAKNVTNDLYLRGGQLLASVAFNQPYAYSGAISQPRTLGISVDRSF